MMKILITADWHVRGERPLCRLDEDWIESQRKTISEIRSVFENNGCDQMWILGDVFDAPRCATAANRGKRSLPGPLSTATGCPQEKRSHPVLSLRCRHIPVPNPHRSQSFAG